MYICTEIIYSHVTRNYITYVWQDGTAILVAFCGLGVSACSSEPLRTAAAAAAAAAAA